MVAFGGQTSEVGSDHLVVRSQRLRASERQDRSLRLLNPQKIKRQLTMNVRLQRKQRYIVSESAFRGIFMSCLFKGLCVTYDI